MQLRLLILLFFVNTAYSGDIIGNGGGLSENNLQYSWAGIERALFKCASFRECHKDDSTRSFLLNNYQLLLEEKDDYSFVNIEEDANARVLWVEGKTIYINESRLYPDGEPLSQLYASEVFYQAWFDSFNWAESAILAKNVSLFFQEDERRWSLAAYDMPEIRLIKNTHDLYFQDHLRVYNLQTYFLTASNDQVCTESRIQKIDSIQLSSYNHYDNHMTLIYRANLNVLCGAEETARIVPVYWRMKLVKMDGLYEFDITSWEAVFF